MQDLLFLVRLCAIHSSIGTLSIEMRYILKIELRAFTCGPPNRCTEMIPFFETKKFCRGPRIHTALDECGHPGIAVEGSQQGAHQEIFDKREGVFQGGGRGFDDHYAR